MDFLIFFRVKWKLAEIFFFPIITVLIWGLFSVFMQRFAVEAGLIVVIMNLFWSFAHVSQTSTNIAMLEDVWSGSFKQLFVSGITKSEYIIARLIFSSFVAILILSIISIMAYYIFNITLLAENFFTFLELISITLIASMALSVIIASLIISWGKEYGFLAWTILQIFILLSAPFYTVDVLPQTIQYISYVMPYTNVFETTRNLITTGFVDSTVILKGFIIAVLYLFLSFPLYNFAFNRARKNGVLVRLN
ncbi:MAG: ABC transporter permease [Candidatus Aenigmarchaeota archaeon]|nr:ABC transporter permease [Candidatus Aenigmarchaeota archaeon]